MKLCRPGRYLFRALLLCAAVPVAAYAQKQLSGTVTDANTGEPLPAATVQVAGTTHGTTTNVEGVFRIFLRSIPAEINVRFIGYHSASIKIEPDSPDVVQFSLVPTTYELGELVVVDEDPAVNIMRRVIRRKQEWIDSLGTYRAEGYTRFMLYRQFDLVQVREHVSEAYWESGRGAVEFVRAERRYPERSENFRFAGPSYVPNFYDDDIELMGYRFIGPTHPDALDAYTFRLGDRVMVDSSLVYIIYASPKNRFQSTFVGRLSVLAEEYALMDVYLRPSWFAPPPPPITRWRSNYEQHFAPTPENHWVPIDLRVAGSVEFGRFGATYPPARFEQVSRLTYHIPGWPSPDSLYRKGSRLVRDPFAAYQQFLFEGNPAEVAYTEAERQALDALNPNQTLDGAFWPTGLLAQYGAVRVAEPVEDPLVVSGESIPWPRPWAWYNRVDGVQIGLSQRLPLTPSFAVDVGAGYTWKRKTPVYRAEVLYRQRLGRGPVVLLRTGLLDYAVPIYSSGVYSRVANSLGTYLGYDDYFDYYRNRTGFAKTGLKWGPVQVLGGITVEEHSSLEKLTSHDGWMKANPQRENPEIDEGTLVGLTASLEIGNPPTTNLIQEGSGLRVSLEHSPEEFLGSDYSYSTLRSIGRLEFPTFFQRTAAPSSLRLYGVASTSWGSVPLQKRSAFDVAVGSLGPFGVFRTLEGLPPTGLRMAAIHWEHDFATAPFELLRIRPLVERGTRLVVHGGHGVIDRNADLEIPSFTHHELGFSIVNPFGYPVRLDWTWDAVTGERRFTFGFVRVPRLRL